MGQIFKIIMRIMFSHVGLCFIVCGYAVAGAFLFQYIELPQEKENLNKSQSMAQNIEDLRGATIKWIIEFAQANSTMEYQDGMTGIKYILDSYQKSLQFARNRTSTFGRMAYRGRLVNESFGWTTTSSILYTATILSTVGYGHIFPVTETGYLVCILYSVFAIPLMSMFLVNISGVMMKGIQHGFNKGCCYFLRRKRDVEHLTVGSAHRLTPVDNYGRPRSAWDDQQHHRYHNNDDGVTHYSGSHRQTSYDTDSYDELMENNLVPAAVSLILFAGYFAIGTAIWHSCNPWTIMESAYFTIITLATIGLGDYVPGLPSQHGYNSQAALVCCAVYIVIGSIVLTTAVGLAFEAMRHRFNKHRKPHQNFHVGQHKLHQLGHHGQHGIYDESAIKDTDYAPPFTH